METFFEGASISQGAFRDKGLVIGISRECAEQATSTGDAGQSFLVVIIYSGLQVQPAPVGFDRAIVYYLMRVNPERGTGD